MAMKTAVAKWTGQEILERTAAELAQVLRSRDGIAIEKSADQMDEVQYASERELAIRNADRESTLLRQVRAALRRIHDGTFGVCVECEYEISPKRCWPYPGRRGASSARTRPIAISRRIRNHSARPSQMPPE